MKTESLIYGGDGDSDKSHFKVTYSCTEPEHRRVRIEHHHTECEISLILEGECSWCILDKIYEGKKGDVFLFSSNENHYLAEISESGPLHTISIRFEPRFVWNTGAETFDLRYLETFFNHNPSFSNVISGTEPAAAEIAGLMKEIYRECMNKDVEYKLVIKAKTLLVLAALVRHYKDEMFQPIPESYTLHLKQLEGAIAFIDKNLTSELDLELIARQAAMSKSYFCTVFKRINGITVWDYIARKRIELAMELLNDCETAIMTVAERCGFTSLSNFNRCFKQITGISPSVYRREARHRDIV